MPRMFTLKRLFLAVTIVSVIAGIAANFPIYSLMFLAVAGWFAPAVVVSVLVAQSSPSRRLTFWTALGTALVGFFLFLPAVMMGPRPLSPLAFYVTNYPFIAFPPAICALVFGGALSLYHPR